jgi:hypothetical protein
MRKLLISVIAGLCLVLAAPALAGHNTYYKVKGGTAKFNIKAASELSSKYGIDIDKTISKSIKKGGSVYQSSNSLTADLKGSFKIKYDTRGADGNKAGVTTITVNRLYLAIGKKNSFLIGNVKGSSTVPGVAVKSGEYRIFNISGGKVKKASGKYEYKFSSGKVTFNSQLTNLMNTFGTPQGTFKASAKINIGSVSVKVK